MDVRMPNLDGLEATRRIVGSREDGPRVLILTTFDLDVYVYEALLAGASGFVLKDIAAGEARRRDPGHRERRGPALADGHPEADRGVRTPAARRRAPVAAGARAADRRARPRSCALVARGLSNAEIAAQAFVSEPTVKTHVARILMKLGLRDRVQVVVYAYEHGLAKPGI